MAARAEPDSARDSDDETRTRRAQHITGSPPHVPPIACVRAAPRAASVAVAPEAPSGGGLRTVRAAQRDSGRTRATPSPRAEMRTRWCARPHSMKQGSIRVRNRARAREGGLTRPYVPVDDAPPSTDADALRDIAAHNRRAHGSFACIRLSHIWIAQSADGPASVRAHRPAGARAFVGARVSGLALPRPRARAAFRPARSA
jgi:hypothetical protein